MALLFCDGADAFTTVSDILLKWASNTSFTVGTAAGRFGGGALQSNSTQYTCKLFQNVSSPSGATQYWGFWIKATAASANNGAGYGLTYLNGQSLLGWTSASVPVLQAQGQSTILATGSAPIGDGNWHWVEFSVMLAGAASTSACYVDGVPQWNGTYNIGAAAAVTSMGLGGGYSFGSAVGSTTFDDVIFWDNTSSAFNTSPLGPRRIGTLNPSAAGASTQFTPSTAPNYSCVDQPYSGTAYVQDAGSGKTDLYATPGLAYTPNSQINAAVVNTYALDPAGSGTRTITAKLRSGSTPAIASGAAHALGAAAVTFQDVFLTDSAGTAWTSTTINAAQPGIGD